MGEHPGAPALGSLSQFTLSLEFVEFCLPGVDLTPSPISFSLSQGVGMLVSTLHAYNWSEKAPGPSLP